MNSISAVKAREIIDSRGNPTVEVDIILADGTMGRGAVPSGASTGAHEAVELRDGAHERYMGKGVLKAVAAVQGAIADCLIGKDPTDQRQIDSALCAVDGSANKGNLGANAILGASLAVAHAAANAHKKPLYSWLALDGDDAPPILPVPLMNIINGGQHADNKIDIQEFMILPVGASSFSEALRMGVETFHTLQNLLKKQGLSTAVGDEGGFAPDLPSARAALDFILSAIEKAGYRPGKDIAFALDCAATEYYSQGAYVLAGEEKTLSTSENVSYLEQLVADYPIISIEDGCAEDDWDGWQQLTRRLGDSVQLVGDDLFVTNTARIEKGIDCGAANSVLVKINQIGTLTETFNAMSVARAANFSCILSHRSGETEDSSIADIAVATNCGQIKAGAPCRSERLAKYNRLLRIEAELEGAVRYGCADFLTRARNSA